MAPHQQRVAAERAELAERLDKLAAFIHSERFADVPDAEQERLRRQRVHMRGYLHVLDERMGAWGAS
jgi:hypothetical protein